MNSENISFIETELSFDEVTTSSTKIQSNTSKSKKHTGHPFGKVWKHITKEKETSYGHYKGIYNYCYQY